MRYLKSIGRGEMMKADRTARRVAEVLWEREGPARALGIELRAIAAGRAEIAMTVTQEMLNGHDTAHGGIVFTLADTAFAYACNSANARTVAQSATIAFLSPAKLGETLIACAERIAEQGRSGSYAVTVRGEDGRVVATFQGLSRTVGGPIVQEGYT
jgi:acyl-CoA thioesterase